MIVIGSLLASGIDPLINYFHYTFAWNAHALNMGSWLAFFPFTRPDPLRRGPGLVCAAVSLPRHRARGDRMPDHPRAAPPLPGIANIRSFSVAVCASSASTSSLSSSSSDQDLCLPADLGSADTVRRLRIPVPHLRECFRGRLRAGFTYLRMSAHDDPNGISFVERGIDRWAPRWRTPVTLLAVIGFCAVWARWPTSCRGVGCRSIPIRSSLPRPTCCPGRPDGGSAVGGGRDDLTDCR